jgi:hypothetical protein
MLESIGPSTAVMRKLPLSTAFYQQLSTALLFFFFLPAFAGFAIAPTSHRQIAINKQRQHTLALPNFYFPGAQPARSSCQKLLPEADSTSAT